MAIGVPYLIGQGIASTNTETFSPASATGAGDTLCAWLSSSNASNNIVGVSDTQNGAWDLASPAGSNTQNGQWYVMPNAKSLGVTDVITCTWTTGGSKGATVLGVSGCLPSMPDIGGSLAEAAGNSTTMSQSTGTLNYAGELALFGATSGNAGGTHTWSAPFVVVGSVVHTGTSAWQSVAYVSGLTTAGQSGGPSIPVATNWAENAITLIPLPVPGTPYVIGHGHAGAGSSTFSLSPAATTTAGDTYMAFASGAQGAPSSLSDPENGNWIPFGQPAVMSGGQAGQWFIMPRANSIFTTDSITATYATTLGAKYLSVLGCSGLSGSVDATPPASDITGTASSGSSGPLSVAAEVVLAGQLSANAGGAPSWASPFANLTHDTQGTNVYSSTAYDVVSSEAAVTASASFTASVESAISIISLPAAGMVFLDDQAGAPDTFASSGGGVAVSLADVGAGVDAVASGGSPGYGDTAGAADGLSVSGTIVITFSPAAPSPVVTGQTAHEVSEVPVTLPPASPVFILSQMPVMYLQNLLTGQWIHRDVYNVTQPSVTWNLNAPGTFTVTLTPPVAALLDKTGNPAMDIWQTACYLEEAGEIRFGGILTDMSPQGPALGLTFTEFSGYASGMPYEGVTQTKTDYDALDAVRYIWAWLQSQPDGNLGFVLDSTEAGTNIGATRPLSTETLLSAPADPGDFKISIVPLGAGQGPSAWTRKALIQIGSTVGVVESATSDSITIGGDGIASYQPAGSVVGLVGPETPYVLAWYNSTDCAQEIASIQSEVPFDFYEKHSWTDATKTGVSHRLHFGVPRIGARRSDLRFAEGENIIVPATGSRPAQTGIYANNVVGMGAGQGSATVRSAATIRDGRLKRTYVYQDQTINRKDRLASRVAAVMASVRLPDTVTSIQVINHPNAGFGTFHVGDDILPILASGWRNTAIWSRITSIQQDPTTQVMTIGLARSDSFTYVTQTGTGGTI